MFGMGNITGRFGVDVDDEIVQEASLRRRAANHAADDHDNNDDDDDDDCLKLPSSCDSHVPWSRDLPGLLSELNDADYVLINQGAHGAPYLDEASPALLPHAEYALRVMRAAAATVRKRAGRAWAKTSHLPLASSGVRIRRLLLLWRWCWWWW